MSQVGKHGIIIDFELAGARYSATYLPDVAPEQGERSFLVKECCFCFSLDVCWTLSVLCNCAVWGTLTCPSGWDQAKTIQNLVWKAGYSGSVTPEVVAAILLTRYQSSKASLRYPEYLAGA